jgi:hypothetical protein
MLTDCYIYDILLINLLLLAMLIGDVKQQSNRQNHIDLYNINQSIDSVQSIYQLICEIHQEPYYTNIYIRSTDIMPILILVNRSYIRLQSKII